MTGVILEREGHGLLTTRPSSVSTVATPTRSPAKTKASPSVRTAALLSEPT